VLGGSFKPNIIQRMVELQGDKTQLLLAIYTDLLRVSLYSYNYRCVRSPGCVVEEWRIRYR
jgi:hypothetical protein